MTRIVKFFAALSILFLGVMLSAVSKEMTGRTNILIPAVTVLFLYLVMKRPLPVRRREPLYYITNENGSEGLDGFTKAQISQMNDPSLEVRREEDEEPLPIRSHPDFLYPLSDQVLDSESTNQHCRVEEDGFSPEAKATSHGDPPQIEDAHQHHKETSYRGTSRIEALRQKLCGLPASELVALWESGALKAEAENEVCAELSRRGISIDDQIEQG